MRESHALGRGGATSGRERAASNRPDGSRGQGWASGQRPPAGWRWALPPPAPRWPRLLLAVGLALVAVAGLGLAVLHGVAERYGGALSRERLLDPTARREGRGVTGPLNYLLIGSDRRASNPDAGQRADTILVVHIPAELDRAYLVSVPRDLLVSIPATQSVGYPGGTDKINNSFQLGGAGPRGAQLLSATISQLTGLRFNGAAIVEFSGFRKVIDLVGGVTMCVDRQVRSIHTGEVFVPGCRPMNGAQALDYARQRDDLPNGDYDRQRHQQQLVKAIIDKVDIGDLAADPAKLDELIRAVGSLVTVDAGGISLKDLALALRGLRTEALVGVQVPSHAANSDSASYVLLDPGSDGLFASLRRAEVGGWAATNPAWVNRL